MGVGAYRERELRERREAQSLEFRERRKESGRRGKEKAGGETRKEKMGELESKRNYLENKLQDSGNVN